MLLTAKFFALVALIPATLACSASKGGVPTAKGTISSKAVIEVAAGKTFDCGWKRYDRGSGACGGQSEGNWKSAVFYLQAGATLRNCIIGPNQAEGVHCNGRCTLNSVWFEDVCEDGVSIKNDKPGDESFIIGGGAYNGDDKIIQHNGCGKVNIIDFYVENYGKLYRSCGNCSKQCKRTVNIKGVVAKNGGELAGMNKAYGDIATLSNNCVSTSSPCVLYNGCTGGCSVKKVGSC